MKILLPHGEHYKKKEKDNMIELSKFSKACKEVLEILNNVEEKDLEKIPKDFIDDIKKNADKNYIPNIDINKKFEEQELLPETIDLLAYIYRKYWCNQEEKEEFDTIMKKNDIEYQNEMMRKYDINEKIKKRKKTLNIENTEKSLIETEENKNIIKIIFKYLKSIFKK